MVWAVKFSAAAEKSFGKLERRVQTRIQKFIDKRIATDADPRRIGEAYSGPLKGYWKYRIGDYRLVCEIQDNVVCVLVIAIGDRKDIYR